MLPSVTAVSIWGAWITGFSGYRISWKVCYMDPPAGKVDVVTGMLLI
jgi:hypothetical protein